MIINVVGSDKLRYDISVNRSAGNEKIKCPKCSNDRRNKTDKSLSWDHAKGVGNCHHCNSSFYIPKQREYNPQKQYVKPIWRNNTALSNKAIRWFESRKISQSTLIRNQVTEGPHFMPQDGKENNTVQFNYFRDGALVNIKYRDGRKNFVMTSGAELILYGLDDIKGKETIIICEGEIDKFSFDEIGLTHSVSVPNGASLGNNNLEYIDNCISYLEGAKEIILATDNDNAGKNLRDTLAKRLGVERCSILDFAEFKDANEILISSGRGALKSIYDKRKPYPVEGIFTMMDIKEQFRLLFENGLQPGAMLQLGEIDEHLSFVPGMLYIWHGTPSHGKSEVVDFICVRLNVIHGWKIGYYSPENRPTELHGSKIFEKLHGDSFSRERVSEIEYTGIFQYMNENFFFVNPAEGNSIDDILEKARYLVRRFGIKVFVIDPYNKLEHNRPSNMNETEYVSELLDKIIRFAGLNGITFFLVAHPTKLGKIGTGAMKKHEIPTLYDISGSANFFNKTDFGVCVYRDFDTNMTSLIIQKCKFKHLGKVGSIDMVWEPNSGRYSCARRNPDGTKVIIPDRKPYLIIEQNVEKPVEYNEVILPNNELEVPF